MRAVLPKGHQLLGIGSVQTSCGKPSRASLFSGAAYNARTEPYYGDGQEEMESTDNEEHKGRRGLTYPSESGARVSKLLQRANILTSGVRLPPGQRHGKFRIAGRP